MQYGIYVCLRLSEGYSCIIQLQHCWRKVTELALRAWEKQNIWMNSKHFRNVNMVWGQRNLVTHLSSFSLQPEHNVSLVVEQQSSLQLWREGKK